MFAHIKSAALATLVCLLIFFVIRLNLPKDEVSPAQGFILNQTVPVIQYTDLEGVEGRLTDHSGHIIIVNFWATFCEPCIKEVPSLLELVRKMNGKIKLIAISGDSNLDDINSFIKVFPGLKDKNVTLIWDKDKNLLKDFKVIRLPETFILDQNLRFKKKVSGEVNWTSEDALAFFNKLVS